MNKIKANYLKNNIFFHKNLEMSNVMFFFAQNFKQLELMKKFLEKS